MNVRQQSKQEGLAISESTTITKEIAGLVGVTGQPSVVEVERGLIARLARAVGDDNPLWLSREHAMGLGHGDVICPPYLLITHLLTGSRRGLPDISNPALKKRLDGGGTWEFYKTIKLGDVLVAVSRIARVFEKEGKNGKMLFSVTETTVMNQAGEIVGKCETTLIQY